MNWGIKMTRPNDEIVDDLFAQARNAKVTPPDDLMARILAEAETVQAGFTHAPQASRPTLWATVLDAIGGWPAVGGLAAATVAGVWIGIAPPASIEEFSAGLIGDEVGVSLLTGGIGFDAEAFIDG